MRISKKFVGDILLNIAAAGLPIVMLQLVIYPLTAKTINSDEYGLMITIYSIWIMVSDSLGNTLNNIRLLYDNQYRQKEISGDFLVIFRRWVSLGSAGVFFIIWFYCGGFNAIHILLGMIVSALVFSKSYFEVGFRLKLNYKAIVINNALLSIGYFVGFVIFKLTNIWEFIFLVGFASSALFCLKKTSLHKEAFDKTELYNDVVSDSYKLIISNVINKLTGYADKLVLYPLMGGTAVSIYYTATILGKITGMLVGPVNSVILSYIAKWKSKNDKILIVATLCLMALCMVGYVLTIILGRPIIGILFPQWVDEVMKYIPITTITVMINIITSSLNPFVMKFCKMNWQIIINAGSAIVYFGSAILLWNLYGLMGFCIGTILGAISKLLISLLAYFRLKQ